MADRLRAPAPAKVNLTLEVLGRRPDGYHELASVMQTLALADEVEVEVGGREGIEVSGPHSLGTPVDGSNLAWRAVEALAARVGRRARPVRVRLLKRVPPAGGLGGGASDAATVLRLLGRAWEADEEALFAAACEVGSDEPFFLVGGTALVSGRGERVRALPPLPPHGIVLLLPRTPLEAKTRRMFEAISSGPFDDGARSRILAERLPCTLRSETLYNRFEPAARQLFPDLAEEWSRAESATRAVFRLAGAGPTLFWVGPPAEAGAVAERLRAAGFGERVVETRTAEPRWRP